MVGQHRARQWVLYVVCYVAMSSAIPLCAMCKSLWNS